MKASNAYLLLTGLLILLTLFSCQLKKAEEKPLIVVSIYPYEILLKELIGSTAEVVSIIPPSASPHDWSPNPSNLAALNKASLIVTNGLGLEHSLSQTLSQHRDKLLEISDLIQLDPDQDLAVNPGQEGEPDPHIWTSVAYLLRMVDALHPELQKRFPDQADSIASSCGRIKTELSRVDARIRQESSSFKDPGIITYHNSFGYFMRDYGIKHLASVQSSPGKEPGPRELSELGSLIKTNGVKAIFVEPQISQKSAEVLAREFDLKILILDPIGNSLGANTIGEFLLSNWSIMKLALEPAATDKR